MSNTRHIAIVDDHALFRKGLSALIQYFPGYSVLFEASDGKDMIQKLDPANLPDIVLLDISMPEMDGYASAGWLQANYPQIRSLALSTMDAESAIIRMIRQGAKGYILKDAEPDELRTALDQVITFGYFFNDMVTHKVMKSLTGQSNESAGFMKLSDRELEFLRQICSEKSYAEIADVMCVSPRTVEGYRNTLCEKLQLKTRTGLALYAIKNGLVSL